MGNRHTIAVFAFFTVAALAAGCGTTSGGAWDATGYRQATYEWKAPYPKGQQTLLGAEWQLDNWKKNGDGTWAEKTGNQYVGQLEEDEDRDGTISPGEIKRVALYDLKFVNARDNGVIWVQTRPVKEWNAEKALDVLLENYADSLVGTGLYEQGTVFGTVAPKARSFTTFVTQKAPMKLGPHQGLGAVIELAESDRLRSDPAWRSAKIRIAVTKFKYTVESYGPSAPLTTAGTQGASHAQKIIETHTAVMLVGYYNDAKHFESGLGSFDQLVSLLNWPPGSVVTPAAAAPEAPPPPAATPPPEATPPAAPEATTPS